MAKYTKLFGTHTEYNTYITGNNKILPNLSYCEDNHECHYNPWVDPRLIATFNITNTSSATQIINSSATSQFSEIEIDGVVQSSVVSTYIFSTTGEHTVKYTLTDPTTIGNSTFSNCTNLTNVIIPDSVVTIGNGAFANCSGLTSVIIPDSVTTLGDDAFYQCTSLTSVTIGNGVTTIGSNTFQYCLMLTSVTIGNSVTTIDSYAFSNCGNLTSITLPNSVTTINDAFYSCSGLTSITSLATTAPTIIYTTFRNVKSGGTLTVPSGSTGYDTWMGTGDYYLGKYNWTKVEQ